MEIAEKMLVELCQRARNMIDELGRSDEAEEVAETLEEMLAALVERRGS